MIVKWAHSYLLTQGISSSELFGSRQPDSPDNCVTLYAESGVVTAYQSDYGSDWAGLMVRVRGTYSYASDKAWEIHNLLTGINSLDTDDFYLTASQIQAQPAQIDVDEMGRREYTAHYLFLIAQKTNNHRISIFNETFDSTFDSTFR